MVNISKIFNGIGNTSTLSPIEYRKLICAILETWRKMNHSLAEFCDPEDFFNRERWAVSLIVIKEAITVMKEKTVRVNIPGMNQCLGILDFSFVGDDKTLDGIVVKEGILLNSQGDLVKWKASYKILSGTEGILKKLELEILTNTEFESLLEKQEDSGKKILEKLKNLFSDDSHRRERKRAEIQAA